MVVRVVFFFSLDMDFIFSWDSSVVVEVINVFIVN